MQAETRKIIPLPISASKCLTSVATHTTSSYTIVTLTTRLNRYGIDTSKSVEIFDNREGSTNTDAYWFVVFMM